MSNTDQFWQYAARDRGHVITKISLKLVTAPSKGTALKAPPVLMASDHSVDYTCGQCGTILMHAEENQVHGILIHCANCGSFNSTDS